MSGRVPRGAIKLGWPVVAAPLCVCLLALAAVPPGPAGSAPRGESKRVLMLHSFGRDFLPWSAYALSIKANLDQQSPGPLDIQEHTLLTARFNNPGPEAPFVDYLRSLYQASTPDIVMSIGAPAAHFAQQYREQLFPGTPLVITAVEQRNDGAGVAHEGDLALRSLHAVANAPIFSYQEAFFGDGTGGGPMHPIAELSGLAADATIRILGGEKPGNIKVQPTEFAPPKYDRREMQRWGISESNLPPGSKILFREPSIWKKYSWQMALIASIILVQGVLIGLMLDERRRRRLAEVEARQRLADLAHANRYSAAGELTTSIAHELNQPLGSILTNTEAAELMLKSSSPNLDEVKEILADIRRDNQRASEVIRRLRSVLKRTPFEVRDVDLNETVCDAIGFLGPLAEGRQIALKYTCTPTELRIRGDPIQLQQVVLNLIINAMDAISEAQARRREVDVTIALSCGSAEIRVGDTGPGIAASDLKAVFNPFFTTKPQGMGMGLSIVRTIIEAHHGQIVAENQPSGGALFTIKLPIVGSRST